jgi:hypothetical protein
MTVEKTKDELVIRIPKNLNSNAIQRVIDFILYQELSSKSKAKKADVIKLATDVKKGRWEKYN